MAARAMGNFGLTRLRIVNPATAGPTSRAQRAAAGRRPYPRQGRTVRHAWSRRSPICTLLFATTARAHDQAKPVVGAGSGGAARSCARSRRQAGRHPVRPRACGPAERGGGACRPHHHLSGQSGLRLAQSRAGRAADGLRVVQARDRRRAAVRDAGALRTRLAAPDAGVLRQSGARTRQASNSCGRAEKRETMLVNLRNIFTRMEPTKQDMHTLHGVVMAIAEGRKGPAKGGVLDGEQATRLRALLAEHGQGAVRGRKRHGARAGAAAAAKSDRCRAHPVAGADAATGALPGSSSGRRRWGGISRILCRSCSGWRSNW